jgi:hypothetical protein
VVSLLSFASGAIVHPSRRFVTLGNDFHR